MIGAWKLLDAEMVDHESVTVREEKKPLDLANFLLFSQDPVESTGSMIACSLVFAIPIPTSLF